MTPNLRSGVDDARERDADPIAVSTPAVAKLPVAEKHTRGQVEHTRRGNAGSSIRFAALCSAMFAVTLISEFNVRFVGFGFCVAGSPAAFLDPS